MPRITTYACDKCEKTEEVGMLTDTVPDEPKIAWVLITVTARIHGERTGLYPFRNARNVGCLCLDCAERIGWVARNMNPKAPTFDELLEELVDEKVQERMEP